MTMKNVVSWGVAPCGSYRNRRFGGRYHPHHQGENNQQTESTLAIARDCNIPQRILQPDDGGDTFLRNFGSYKSHKATHPRRHSSTDQVVCLRILSPPSSMHYIFKHLCEEASEIKWQPFTHSWLRYTGKETS
jgi:hypothetical protein